MPQVQRIDPIVLPGEKESVAAYCRVSTDSADQLNSYHSQIAYYTKLINENPEWVLYDLYADEGITGTSIERRDEFKRMIADCREGKIKRILVKSVSRFARNTTELLETTRELKDLGVVVVFEEQGFDTSQMFGEMQLAMFAMAAQEESLSISRNIQWSYQKRMENGTFWGTRTPYGYKLTNGQLEVVADEAKIVNDIFNWYLSGVSIEKIAAKLNEKGVSAHHGRKWLYSTVRQLLNNERYIGDALLQKHYTEDSLKHCKRKNRGNRPQYYVENSHPPIISKTAFAKTQALLKSKNDNPQRTQHIFTHKIVCPDCGRFFRHLQANNKPYWICPNRANGCKGCLPYRFSEIVIRKTIINFSAKLFLYQEQILSINNLLLEVEYRQNITDSKLFELDQSIAALNDKSLTLQKLNTKGFISPDEFRIQSEALASQRQRLTVERNKKLNGLQSHSAIEKLEELQAILSSWPGVPTEFDIDQFDEIVEKIIPTADNKLIFRLHCGLELTEEIPS